MTPTPLPRAAGPGTLVTGIAAFGTLIQVLSDPGPPEVFISIPGAGEISGPSSTMGTTETTSHSSGQRIRTFIATLADGGSLSFPCYWNPADPSHRLDCTYGLPFLFWNGILTKFRLVAPDPTHYTRIIPGVVESIGETYPLDGVMTRNVSIKVAGMPQEVPSAISMTPDSATPTKTGGPGTFSVATGGAPTTWTALSTVPWISITAPTAPQEGDGDVSYTVATNGGTSTRTGHITIAELALSFTVTQAAV